jgi:hypothetical protein
MTGMWAVEHVAAEVVEVLSHAESLFATPGDVAAGDAAGTTGQAAEASRAIAARTADLSGSVAQAHADVLDSAAARLEAAAAADSRLADHVAAAADTHRAGLAQATDLRAAAAEVPARLAPFADIPASELAALKALRIKLAGMQQLMAHHSGDAARVAAEIRALGYGD